jgi:hypothetical protein
MANLENLKQSVRYETIGNATGKNKNAVKCYFNTNKLDARDPVHVNGYVTKFILAKCKKK